MNQLFKRHEIQFIAWFSGIFLVTVCILALTGLLPSEFQLDTSGPNLLDQTELGVMGVNTAPATQSASTAPSIKVKDGATMIAAENPTRIVIPAAGVDSIIRNPSSANATYLDNELTYGPVHYPGSGYPGAGNMFLFGHSTGFKIVQNKAYKVFNDLKNLQSGDKIEIYSDSHVYTYSVRTVKEVDKNDTWVKFDVDKNMLTLSTCDSFGTKSDRYVVEADYTGIGNI